jgi:hypothetical protein
MASKPRTQPVGMRYEAVRAILRRAVGFAVLGRVALLAAMGYAAERWLVPKDGYLLGRLRTEIGWDLEVVCSSLQALGIGHDPYLESKPLSLPYGILHVYLFQPLCAVTSDLVGYPVVFTLIALASGVVLWRIVPATAFDRIAVLIAIFTSFESFKWLLKTGNVAIIELPLAVAVVLLLAERRYHWAGIVFGLMASLKLLPVFGVIAFLFLPESYRLRLQSMAVAIACFLAVHASNALLFARWLPSYAAQLTGRLPGGEFYEKARGQGTFNTVDFVIDWLHWIGFDQPLPGFALACLGLGVGCLASIACARKTPERGELPPVAVASLVILILWLFLPRQKPYSLEAFIPFMIAAGYGAGRATGIAAIVVSMFVPVAVLSDMVRFPNHEVQYQIVAVWAAVLTVVLGAIVQLRWSSRQHIGETQPQSASFAEHAGERVERLASAPGLS